MKKELLGVVMAVGMIAALTGCGEIRCGKGNRRCKWKLSGEWQL